MAVNIPLQKRRNSLWQRSFKGNKARHCAERCILRASSARAFLRDQLPAQFLLASSPRLARPLSSNPSGGVRRNFFLRFHRSNDIFEYPFHTRFLRISRLFHGSKRIITKRGDRIRSLETLLCYRKLLRLSVNAEFFHELL